MRDLLGEFIAADCDDYMCLLLLHALADQTRSYRHFDFNLFDVTIWRESDVVVLQDVLDSSETSVRHIPLLEFSQAIENCRPGRTTIGAHIATTIKAFLESDPPSRFITNSGGVTFDRSADD
jgi:hypothetical protein